MRSAGRGTEAGFIRRVCGAWQGLVRHVARQVEPATIAALGQHLADVAEKLSDDAVVQAVDQAAPEHGFYFCLRCLSYDRGDRSVELLRTDADDLRDYHPIFQAAGMTSPRCKRCASRALWIGRTGAGRLAQATDCPKPPDLRVRDADLPMALGPIMDLADRPQPNPPPGCTIVYPQLVVGYVVHFRCSGCGKRFSAKYSEVGCRRACPNCKTSVAVIGEDTAQFQPKIQCPSCHSRMKVRPMQIGRSMNCPGCPTVLFPLRHTVPEVHESIRGSRPIAKPKPRPPSGDTSAVQTAAAVAEIAGLGQGLPKVEQHLLARDRVIARQQAEIEALRAELEAVNAGQGFRGLAILFDTLLQREDEVAALRKRFIDQETGEAAVPPGAEGE